MKLSYFESEPVNIVVKILDQREEKNYTERKSFPNTNTWAYK